MPRISEIVFEAGERYGVLPWNGWPQLLGDPQIKKHFDDLEFHLNSLGVGDWNILKQKVIPRFRPTKHDASPVTKSRGWQSAMDLLNEAVAYRDLVEHGFSCVRFIRESSRKTPDLAAKKSGIDWGCEVKTINESDIEICLRMQGRVASSSVQLESGFIEKLKKTNSAAGAQLKEFHCDKRAIFVILNFDDSLHEYIDGYMNQIKNWLVSQPMEADLYCFMARPPFATRHPRDWSRFVWPSD